ncbi:hypothetical protein ACTGJ2_07795 [Streptococcus suis]|uniref:Phage protein n=3 Tax=Streptococcus suis TaxID=1307 RepID=A0A822VH91_STRSU|nr:hypothetical protein [Streptococcus suis]QBX21702.1 hypothetical protein Javan589_0025 [Streptococcus phage Javan589]QBX30650.1 hypothetical protein Javan562_0028 [Streptococcus phage Javan562]MCG9862688.1 hypothetical protein [Streptococcus suis]MCL4922040.1 hypothetical protein [Streptococcus suis]MDD7566626.1 hypothetical protein [Streptococcus suis]
MIKKSCAFCGRSFTAESKRVKYCSDKCRKDGARDKQRKLMKQKRADLKKQKSKKDNPNNQPAKKRKKKKNLLKYYQDFKTKILANEAEFGFTSRTIVEGVEVHEPDFEEQVINKIKEQSK